MMIIKDTFYASIFEVEYESLPEELKEVAIRTIENDSTAGTRVKLTVESLYSNGETDIAEAYLEWD